VTVQRDADHGGGPFAYYAVSATTIHEAAADIDVHASGLGTLRRQLDRDHRRALSAVGGGLQAPMADAGRMAAFGVSRVEQAAAYASGCLHLFGDFVNEYDHDSTSPRSVERLNEAYTEARLNDFGLDPADYATGNGPAARDYDADWRARNADLVGPHGSLTSEYRQLEARLDAQAESVAAMLNRGPNPDDLRTLWTLGALPSDAETIWPSLSEVPLLRLPPDMRDGYDDHRNLYDLNDRELMRLGERGFRSAGELFAEHMTEEPAYSDDGPGLDDLYETATFIFFDPAECFGDDASLGGCGLEVLGATPVGKPLKALKAYQGVRRLRRLPEPGQEIPPIHAGRQGKHIPGHPNFDSRRSILEADPHELRKLAGTGTPMNKVPRGQPGFKETIDYGFPIGMYVSDGGKSVRESTRAMLVYAKNGIHIYPARPQP
jgi:hypothetical protein